LFGSCACRVPVSNLNTFTAKIDHSLFNNSCLRLPASILVDLIFQSHSFSFGGKLGQQLQYIQLALSLSLLQFIIMLT
jgi:hypothetical protein